MGIIELHSWRNWIACQPPTLKVVGSIPAGCTTQKSPFMGLFAWYPCRIAPPGSSDARRNARLRKHSDDAAHAAACRRSIPAGCTTQKAPLWGFFAWYPCPMTRRQGENHAGDAIAPQNAANDTLLKSLRSLRPTRGGMPACGSIPTTRRTRRLAAEVSPPNMRKGMSIRASLS